MALLVSGNGYSLCAEQFRRLNQAIASLMNLQAMDFIEDKIVEGLCREPRKVLSRYGAVGAVAAGHQWHTESFDPTNVIFAMVWEFWLQESHHEKFQSCRNITNCVTAGDILECIMGSAWLWKCHNQEVSERMKAFRKCSASTSCWTYTTSTGDLSDVLSDHEACKFVTAHGLQCGKIVPFLEEAVNAMLAIWKQCPQIQCTRANYNHKLAQSHLDALELGFVSGTPFYDAGVPVLPQNMWRFHRAYTPDIIRKLLKAFNIRVNSSSYEVSLHPYDVFEYELVD